MTHFSNSNFLDPKVAFSSKARATFKDLSVVATRIGNIGITQLVYE